MKRRDDWGRNSEKTIKKEKAQKKLHSEGLFCCHYLKHRESELEEEPGAN